MAEFLKWSVKHTTSKQKANPVNVDALLRRLFALAKHPSPHRRAGASTAFNHMYRVFREEEALVDQYAFMIAEHMLYMLQLSCVARVLSCLPVS